MQNQHSFVWIYPNNRCNTLIARHMHPIRTHSPTDRRTGASSGCLPNAESFLSVSTEKLPSVDGTFLRFEQQDTAIPHPYQVRPLTRFRLGISPSCHGRACRRATHSRSVSLGLSGRNRHPPPPCRRRHKRGSVGIVIRRKAASPSADNLHTLAARRTTGAAVDYQLAFFTPGIKPLEAISRNWIRLIPNWRM